MIIVDPHNIAGAQKRHEGLREAGLHAAVAGLLVAIHPHPPLEAVEERPQGGVAETVVVVGGLALGEGQAEKRDASDPLRVTTCAWSAAAIFPFHPIHRLPGTLDNVANRALASPPAGISTPADPVCGLTVGSRFDTTMILGIASLPQSFNAPRTVISQRSRNNSTAPTDGSRPEAREARPPFPTRMPKPWASTSRKASSSVTSSPR